MTLVAALNDGESVLLAADGETHNRQVPVSVKKLDNLPDRPIAWGFSGDESIGLDFGSWMRGRDWRAGEDWESFRQDAAITLARLNGRRRELAELAKVPVAAESLTDVLIAGYIDSRSGILQLDSDGGNALHRMMNIAAIGSGHNHAIIALQSLRLVEGVPKMDPFRLLELIMKIAIQVAPECGPPIRILRISKTGVQEVRAGEKL